MKWVQFYRPDLSGELSPALGSDGVFPCDGRWSPSRCLMRADQHAAGLNRHLNKGFTHRALFYGEAFSRSTKQTQILPIKDFSHGA